MAWMFAAKRPGFCVQPRMLRVRELWLKTSRVFIFSQNRGNKNIWVDLQSKSSVKLHVDAFNYPFGNEDKTYERYENESYQALLPQDRHIPQHTVLWKKCRRSGNSGRSPGMTHLCYLCPCNRRKRKVRRKTQCPAAFRMSSSRSCRCCKTKNVKSFELRTAFAMRGGEVQYHV